MVYKISLKIDGKKQDFKKDDIYLADNILASKHNLKQTNFYAKDFHDPDELEQLQKDYLQMIVDMFGGEFTYEDLATGLPNSQAEKLDEIYLAALGGEADEEEKK